MKKLRNQNGLTLTEMLCTVIIVLLFSSLVAVGAMLRCGASAFPWRTLRPRSFAPR